MKKYWLVFQNSLQQSFTYRGEIIFRALRHLMILILFLSLWGAVFKTKSIIDGFNSQSIVTYYILVEIIDMIYTTKPAKILVQQIKNGDLSNYLIKPVNYYLQSFCQVLGEQVASSSLSILLVIVIFILFPNFVNFQSDLKLFTLFIISLTLAWIIYFQMFFLIGLSSLWFSETNYFRIGFEQLLRILAGKWIPLVFFSGVIASVIKVLPFQYLFNFIVNVYQGGISIEKIFYGLAIETVWLFMMLILGNIMWKKGLLKYESYGK